MIKVPKLIIQVIEEELVSRLQWLIPAKFATFDWPSTLKMDSSYWYCLAESWGSEGTIVDVCTTSIGMALSLVMQVDTAVTFEELVFLLGLVFDLWCQVEYPCI